VELRCNQNETYIHYYPLKTISLDI